MSQYIWEYKLDNGKFKKFDLATIQQIEKAYREHKPKVGLSKGKHFQGEHAGTYVILLQEKPPVLINQITNFEREVRRKIVQRKRPASPTAEKQQDKKHKGDEDKKTGVKDAAAVIKTDVFGPCPSPMHKGNSWVQFTRNFRKEINNFLTKIFGEPKNANMDRKSIESVFYMSLKIVNVISKYEKYKSCYNTTESPTVPPSTSITSPKKTAVVVDPPTEEELMKLKNLKTAIETLKATLGIGSNKPKNFKECLEKDNIPALKTIVERGKQYKAETDELKALNKKEISEEMKKKKEAEKETKKAEIKIAIDDLKSNEEKVKKQLADMVKVLRNTETKIKEEKEKLKNLPWDNMHSRPRHIATIKSYMTNQLEVESRIRDKNEEQKENGKAMKYLQSCMKDLTG